MPKSGTCDYPPEVETLTRIVAVTGVAKPRADALMYQSCEEGEVAGEERVRGAKAEEGTSRKPWCYLPATETITV